MGKKAVRLKRKVDLPKVQDKKDLSNVELELSKAVSREMKHSIISIFVVVLIVISSSFAIYTAVEKSNDYNTITVGILKVDFYQDTINTLNLNGAYPTSDADGMRQDGYSFKISNTGNLNAQYKIRILDDAEMISRDGCLSNQLDKRNIRVSINDGTPFTLEAKKSQGYTIELADLAPSNVKEYNIKIWIDEKSGNEVLGKHYHGKIVIDSVNLSTTEGTV